MFNPLDPANLAWEVPTLLSGAGWVALHVRQSRAESYRRGSDAERVIQQQKALERLFGYLNEQADALSGVSRRVQAIREVLIRNEMVVPGDTQAGVEGRGAPNPLRGVFETLSELPKEKP